MRLIFSRKGFDGESGGVPSPILPDGTLRPLPIPYRTGSRTFTELAGPAPRPARLVADLTAGRRTPWGDPLTPSTPTHLDPDLDAGSLPRPDRWRPAFGQTAAAQGHLAAEGVGPGDLFLFFGWFRRAEQVGEQWRFVRGARDLHVLFGWLQVGAVHPAGPRRPAPVWLRTHEHFRDDLGPRSTVYSATDALTVDGEPIPGVPGAGLVRTLRDALILTAPGASRSVWRLPACLAPDLTAPRLTYHRDPARWSGDGPDHVRLRTVGKGQEFVYFCDESTRAWLRTVLAPEGTA